MSRRKHQPSTVSRLPEEVRDTIAQLRASGRTLDEILEALRQLLPRDDVPSRSALGRHIKNWEDGMERVREARLIAEAMARKFGDKETSDVARANMELLHSLTLKLLLRRDADGEAEGDADFTPKELASLATVMEKTAKASKLDFDQQLAAAKEQERRATLVKAADVVEREGKEAGWSNDTIHAIKSKVLGIGQ